MDSESGNALAVELTTAATSGADIADRSARSVAVVVACRTAASCMLQSCSVTLRSCMSVDGRAGSSQFSPDAWCEALFDADSHTIAHIIPDTGSAVRTVSKSMAIRCFQLTIRVYRGPADPRTSTRRGRYHSETRVKGCGS